MEKRKWLWKRKSSDRSPGETESSESISSHSERYSDDQETFKASPNNTQSPEVSSKASANCEDVNDSIKCLTEKLSAALVNVSAKEDLVKQHAKVAEEAIAGWEKAENEVVVLKQKLEAAVQQNSTLEDRVSHLDGALKECVRQLRQAREEQEQKIQEAVAKTSRDWETTKFELESQLLELQDKAGAVKSDFKPHFSPDVLHKIEALEKENSALKLELSSQLEEFEVRTLERDLSTQAAETASKQLLESIKKVAKLEAECRRLKAIACKSSLVNDHKSPAASSIYVESFTDSHSENGEGLNMVDFDTRKMGGLEANKGEPSCSDSWASALIAELDQFKNEKVINRNLPTSSIEIDLMDDFLEMERLAALSETKTENQCLESKATAEQCNDSDNSLKAELEAMIHRTAELEVKLEMIELEKAELERSAKQCNDSDNSLKAELEAMIHRTAELEEKLEKIEFEKAELERSAEQSNDSDNSLKAELEAMIHRTAEIEEKLEKIELVKAELEIALTKSQQNLEASKLQLRDTETKLEQLQRELSMANEAKEHLESQLSSMETDTETMSAKINSLEAEIEKERALSAQVSADANEAKQLFESQLISIEADALTMSSKIDSLETEVEKERALSAQITVKCQELEEELSRKRQHEAEIQQTANSNVELKIKQEDLAVAAGKLAECQKTIASLGQQLKSLATLEDFLIDTTGIPELPRGGSLIPKAGTEPWKLHSNETFSPKVDPDSPRVSTGPSVNKNDGNTPPSSSSSSSIVSSSHASSEKNRNGFAKFFTRSKNGIQLEI